MPGFGLARRRVLRLAAGGFVSGFAEIAGAERRQRARLRHLPLVVLDPGHGGIDPGAIGAGGIFEKRITFATATPCVVQAQLSVMASCRFALQYQPM